MHGYSVAAFPLPDGSRRGKLGYMTSHQVLTKCELVVYGVCVSTKY